MASQSPFSMEAMLPSSLRRRMSSPGPTEKGGDPKMKEQTNKARDALSKQLEECKDVLLAHMVCIHTRLL